MNRRKNQVKTKKNAKEVQEEKEEFVRVNSKAKDEERSHFRRKTFRNEKQAKTKKNGKQEEETGRQ